MPSVQGAGSVPVHSRADLADRGANRQPHYWSRAKPLHITGGLMTTPTKYRHVSLVYALHVAISPVDCWFWLCSFVFLLFTLRYAVLDAWRLHVGRPQISLLLLWLDVGNNTSNSLYTKL